MKKLVLTGFVVCIFLSSCVNYFAARDIMHNYPKHYNGIDTLIRINGYYYFTDEEGIRGPISFYSDGTLRTANLIFRNHARIFNYLNKNFSSLQFGHFRISLNTIKAKWVFRYDVLCYDLYEEIFLIKNDTTLLRVYEYTTASEQKVNTDTIAYRFHPFEFDRKRVE